MGLVGDSYDDALAENPWVPVETVRAPGQLVSHSRAAGEPQPSYANGERTTWRHRTLSPAPG